METRSLKGQVREQVTWFNVMLQGDGGSADASALPASVSPPVIMGGHFSEYQEIVMSTEEIWGG